MNTISPFSKLQNTKKRLRKMIQRPNSCRLCFRFIFLYLYSKDASFEINPKGIEMLEELVIYFLPTICSTKPKNLVVISYIMFSLNEIYFKDLVRNLQSISKVAKISHNHGISICFYLL